MKNKTLDFEIDYIGDQSSLTVDEEKALSNYFKQKRIVSKQVISKPIRKRKLVIA